MFYIPETKEEIKAKIEELINMLGNDKLIGYYLITLQNELNK